MYQTLLFVKESISEFLLDRLDKSNVAKLFAYYNGISNTKSRKCINDSKEFVEGTIECIAADISENIRTGPLLIISSWSPE